MLNKIFLQGRLTADPMLRNSGSGTPVCTFTIACDRDFKDKATGKHGTDFLNIVCFRNTATFASQYFKKGRMAIVDGRLQIRNYTDKDGNKRNATDIVADNIYFGDSKPADPLDAAEKVYNNAPGVPVQFEEIDGDGSLPF